MPKGHYIRTKEHRENLAIAVKNRCVGTHHTNECKEKMSQSQKKFMAEHPKEARLRIEKCIEASNEWRYK